MRSHVLLVQLEEGLAVTVVERSTYQSQHCICAAGRLCTLEGWPKVRLDEHADVPLLDSGVELDVVHRVAGLLVVAPQVHHLALGHIEVHAPNFGPGYKFIKAWLEGRHLTQS